LSKKNKKKPNTNFFFQTQSSFKMTSEMLNENQKMLPLFLLFPKFSLKGRKF